MPRRLLDQDRQREHRRQHLLQERISRAGERILAKEITDTTRELVKKWGASGQIRPPAEHQRRIEGQLRRIWRASISAMAGRIMEQGKARSMVLERKQQDDKIDRFEQLYMQTVGGTKIAEDIARTTVEQIMTQVAIGRREGMAQSEISKMINGKAASIGRARGAVIARTESHSAGNFGAISAAKDSGLPMQKEWISAQGERTREDHAAVDGQIRALDAPFDVGGEKLMYPGDMAGSAHNVINCRCAQGYIVQD